MQGCARFRFVCRSYDHILPQELVLAVQVSRAVTREFVGETKEDVFSLHLTMDYVNLQTEVQEHGENHCLLVE